MNGVHCQISATSMAISGLFVSQSGCGGLSCPNSFHSALMLPLSNP